MKGQNTSLAFQCKAAIRFNRKFIVAGIFRYPAHVTQRRQTRQARPFGRQSSAPPREFAFLRKGEDVSRKAAKLAKQGKAIQKTAISASAPLREFAFLRKGEAVSRKGAKLAKQSKAIQKTALSASA